MGHNHARDNVKKRAKRRKKEEKRLAWKHTVKLSNSLTNFIGVAKLYCDGVFFGDITDLRFKEITVLPDGRNFKPVEITADFDYHKEIYNDVARSIGESCQAVVLGPEQEQSRRSDTGHGHGQTLG